MHLRFASMTAALTLLCLTGCGKPGPEKNLENKSVAATPHDEAKPPTEAKATSATAETGQVSRAATPSTPQQNMPIAQGNKAPVLTFMQGHWESVDDPKSKVRISGNLWTELYDQETLATTLINFVDDCTSRQPSETGNAFTLESEGIISCYTILEATSDSLKYSYSERGNTLSLRKSKR